MTCERCWTVAIPGRGQQHGTKMRLPPSSHSLTAAHRLPAQWRWEGGCKPEKLSTLAAIAPNAGLLGYLCEASQCESVCIRAFTRAQAPKREEVGQVWALLSSFIEAKLSTTRGFPCAKQVLLGLLVKAVQIAGHSSMRGCVKNGTLKSVVLGILHKTYL